MPPEVPTSANPRPAPDVAVDRYRRVIVRRAEGGTTFRIVAEVGADRKDKGPPGASSVERRRQQIASYAKSTCRVT